MAAQDLIKDDEIRNQAINNDEATFQRPRLRRPVRESAVSRHDRNERVVFTYLDNKEMQGRGRSSLRAKVQKQGHRRPPTNLPHRRPPRPRPRIPLPRVQIHPPLGHQTTTEVQDHRERIHQDHRRLRQLPIRRNPPHRRSRRRLHPRPRRRLQHLLQARPDRRPRPLGPTSPEPHPQPPRCLRPLPRDLGLPQDRRQRPSPHQRQPILPPHLRHKRQPGNLLRLRESVGSGRFRRSLDRGRGPAVIGE